MCAVFQFVSLSFFQTILYLSVTDVVNEFNTIENRPSFSRRYLAFSSAIRKGIEIRIIEFSKCETEILRGARHASIRAIKIVAANSPSILRVWECEF